MVDALVGRLIDQLIGLELLDETLVIVTSDHGENIGEHGRIDHARSMYETTIHVPLVLRYPPRLVAGTVDDRIVSLIDVFPTIEDAAGIANEDAAARSLLSPDRITPEFVVAEAERPTTGIRLLAQDFPAEVSSPIDERLKMLRTRRHKIVWHEKGDPEVYDLAQDPAQKPTLERLAALMTEILDTNAERSLAYPKKTTTHIPDEVFDELEALGYVE